MLTIVNNTDNEVYHSTRGYIHNIRTLKDTYFIIVRTSTDLNNTSEDSLYTQYCLKKNALEGPLQLKREDYVELQGTVDPLKSKYPSYILKNFKLLNKNEALLTNDYKTLEANTLTDNLRVYNSHKILLVKDKLNRSIKNYFESKKCLCIHTPKLLSLCTEGGSQMFQVKNPYKENEKFYLSQSPQLHKQILINSGLSAVYQIGYIYRAEKFKTTRHLNEALCLDYEQKDQGLYHLLNGVKELFIYVSTDLAKVYPTYGIQPLIEEDFKIISYIDSVKLLKKPFGYQITNKDQSSICELLGKKMVFVINYPPAQKPFYIKEDLNFDLLCKHGELISGGVRQSDLEKLIQNIKAKKVSLDPLKGYLNSFKLGISGSSGYGLGLDRLVKFLLDLPNIQSTNIFDTVKL